MEVFQSWYLRHDLFYLSDLIAQQSDSARSGSLFAQQRLAAHNHSRRKKRLPKLPRTAKTLRKRDTRKTRVETPVQAFSSYVTSGEKPVRAATQGNVAGNKSNYYEDTKMECKSLIVYLLLGISPVQPERGIK
jgi:hypothetical protein